MAVLNINSISKKNGDATVLSDISIKQRSLQPVAIVGETGSGKSTLLKIIAGLVQPDMGSVKWGDVQVKGPEERLVPGEPGIEYLSQHFDLPKSLRVNQVLEYATHISPAAAKKIIKVCRIAHVLDRRTDALSGGEKQRVALAQSLLRAPSLLLLDEPYAHLDNVHKTLLKAVIRDIGEKLNITIILVSHDPVDVLSWADWIVVLRKGKITQQGNSMAIYEHPKNEYVGGMLGKYSLLSFSVASQFIRSLPIELEQKKFLIRPWSFVRSAVSRGVPCKVERSVFCGGYSEVELTFESTQIIVHSTSVFEPGETVWLYIPDGKYAAI